MLFSLSPLQLTVDETLNKQLWARLQRRDRHDPQVRDPAGLVLTLKDLLVSPEGLPVSKWSS